jgi:hypothetical protein
LFAALLLDGKLELVVANLRYVVGSTNLNTLAFRYFPVYHPFYRDLADIHPLHH